jgi:hypothetical protein
MAHGYKVLYGDSSFTLRVNLPDDYLTPSSPTITVKDENGSDLLAATAATVYTATTLGAACSAGDEYIELDSGASAVSPDDRLLIEASSSGPREVVECSYYDSSNKYVYLKDYLKHAHANSTAVEGHYITYALDVSTTATFPENKEFEVIWTLGTDNPNLVEHGEIVKFATRLGELATVFKGRYPREWEAFGDSWTIYEDSAMRRLRAEFKVDERDWDKLVSADSAMELVMSQIALLMVHSGGSEWQDEYEKYYEDRNRMAEWFKASTQWFDDNQDYDIDEAEKEPTVHPYSRGF